MRSETMAAAAQLVNPNADVVKKGAAAMMNINAARGLQDVLSSNLGPKGIRSRCSNPNPDPIPDPDPDPDFNPV